MNSFKESLSVYRDAFMQMPLPTRVIGAGLLVVIALGMWLVVSGSGGSESMERIYSGKELTDDEITKLVTAFSNARLNDWKVEYNAIYVPSKYRDEYMRAADEGNAVPLSQLSNQLTAMNANSPFDSESARQASQAHGLELDVARQIQLLPEVRFATVNHDQESYGSFGRRRQSVSVVVIPNGSAPLPMAVLKKIREMVRGNWAGLSPDDVVVTDVNGGGLDPADAENPLLQARLRYEELYRTKARNALALFMPLSIEATVTIDPTMDKEKAILKLDQQPVTLQEQSSQSIQESSRPSGGGVPGVASRAYGGQPVALDQTQMQTTKSTQKNDAITKVTGEEFEASRQASLQPINLTYSIGVPESYYDKVWKVEYIQRNPTTNPGEIPPMTTDERAKMKADVAQKIQAALKTIIPERPAGEDLFPQVEVFSVHDLPLEAVEGPSSTDVAISWLAESWRTLGLIGLAIIALLIARGVGKNAAAPRPDFEEGFGLEIPNLPENIDEHNEEEEGPKLTITGTDLKKELSSLVGANPEAAANVLRGWLDSAAA